MRVVHELAHALDGRDTLVLRDRARGRNGSDDVPVYMICFDILKGEPHFDQRRIKEKLSAHSQEGRATYDMSRLSDTLTYLYHRMLAAIQAANPDVTADASELVAQIKVLIFKGLHHHVPELHEKAFAFAEGTEDFELMLKLLRLWKTVERRNYEDDTIYGQLILACHAKEKEVQEKLSNLWEWESLLDFRAVAKSLTGEQRAELMRRITSHSYYVAAGPCLSVKAEIARLVLDQWLLAMERMDQAALIPLLTAIADKIESKPALFEDVLIVDIYLITLYNLGLLTYQFVSKEAAEKVIQRIEGFSQYRDDADALIFEQVAVIKLDGILHSMDFKDAEKTVTWVTVGMATYGERIRPRRRASLLIGVAEYYIYTEQYSNAVRLLLPNLEEQPKGEAPRPYLMRWIYFFMAHYELGNMDVIEAYSKHALKYMKEHGLQNENDLAFISFFKSLSRKHDPVRKKSEFKRLLNHILPAIEAEERPYYTVRFEFRLWAECKLIERSFGKALMKK